MQIFYLSKLAKQILEVLFASFLMDIRNENDPAFNRANGDGAGGGAGFGRGGGGFGVIGGARWGDRVDVHCCGGHVGWVGGNQLGLKLVGGTV